MTLLGKGVCGLRPILKAYAAYLARDIDRTAVGVTATATAT